MIFPDIYQLIISSWNNNDLKIPENQEYCLLILSKDHKRYFGIGIFWNDTKEWHCINGSDNISVHCVDGYPSYLKMKDCETIFWLYLSDFLNYDNKDKIKELK